MQRLKTSLKRFLWVIGILFGVVYLLFILSYFVFFVWLPSRSHEGELRAVQSKDKPYLAGVDALPQNALIYISEDTAAPELLIAEENNYFRWGGFSLNKLGLNRDMVAINDSNMRFVEPANYETAPNMPETYVINGQPCLTKGGFKFLRTSGKRPSMHYSDFTLVTCDIAEGEVILPNFRLNGEMVSYQNRELSYTGLWSKDGLISLAVPQAYSYDGGFTTPRLQIPLENDKDTLQILTYFTDLKNQAKAILAIYNMYGNGINSQEDFVLGQCRYNKLSTSILITELTEKNAHWHFESDDKQHPISKECKIQVLPLQLVKDPDFNRGN